MNQLKENNFYALSQVDFNCFFYYSVTQYVPTQKWIANTSVVFAMSQALRAFHTITRSVQRQEISELSVFTALHHRQLTLRNREAKCLEQGM